MAGKQAKVLKERQIKMVLAYLDGTRHPDRNKTMFLLSCKAGLRAKEIAELTWEMVTDSEGHLTDSIALTDKAAKGKKGGRCIYMNSVLRESLSSLPISANLKQTVIRSERGGSMTATTVTNWFHRLYKELKFDGCSSHSGRRTFGTNAARSAVKAGCSMKEVQELMGHKDLKTTQKYIDSSEEGKKKLIEMI